MESHRKNLKISEEVAAADPTNRVKRWNLSLAHKKVGAMLIKTSDPAAALEHYRKALELDQKLSTANPLNAEYRFALSLSYSDIGFILRNQGDTTAALENYRKALAIREELAAADPKNQQARLGLAMTHSRIATVLQKRGELNESLQNYRKALAILDEPSKNLTNISARSQWADTNSGIASVHTLLGSEQRRPFTSRLENWRRARSLYQRSLEIWLDMRDRGALPGYRSGDLDECTREIARCEAAIAKLEKN